MNRPNSLLAFTGVLMGAVLISTGCATKKYVRDQVGPAEQRASELANTLAKKNADAIAQLEEKTSKETSRVEERAMTAENKATAAAGAAEQAQHAADQANQLAQNARQLGEQNQSRLSEVANFLENSDKYKLISSETVLFGFDKAMLTPEGREKLDAIVHNAMGMNRFVVEVEGFTDRTGPRDYNLALSRRRADVVVRYLVGKNIPLRRIHMLGLGEEEMANGTMTAMVGTAPGETQAAQQPVRGREARRVEVKIWVPEVSLQAGATPPASSSAVTTTSLPDRPQ